MPPSVTSPAVKPVTPSENVAVTGTDAAFVVEALVEDSTAVGPPADADASEAKDATPAVPAKSASEVIADAIRKFVLLIMVGVFYLTDKPHLPTKTQQELKPDES